MVRPAPRLAAEIRAADAEKIEGDGLRWRNTACRDEPQHDVWTSAAIPTVTQTFSSRLAAWVLGALWLVGLPAAGGAALRDGFEARRAQPAPALIDQAVYLDSTESSNQLQGQVFALVDYPYERVRQALSRPGPWCDILILHLNVKYCRSSGTAGQEVLDTGLGRKTDQPLAEVSWLRLAYRLVSANAQQFKLEMVSANGPLGTHDYRIEIDAEPYANGQTLLRLRYGYAFSLTARWAMQVYLATLGRDKLGFTLLATGADGQPRHVGGLRGVLERNTMRYYLAIQAYLGVQTLPAAQQMQKSLQDWFDATERYAEQLHEISRDDYMAMKSRELLRQRSVLPPVP